MKSVKLEWCLGEIDEAKALLDESVKLYPDYAKLWMMKGQIQVQLQRPDAAREDYKQGVSTTSRPTHPSSIPYTCPALLQNSMLRTCCNEFAHTCSY